MKIKLKEYLIAAVYTSIPMLALAYFYGLHGWLIYILGFYTGMFFQGGGWKSWIN